MFISEFAQSMNTTVDTVKYYIQLGLLTPAKKHSWYQFTNKEIQDFKNILDLKELGLSLEAILKIKHIHETKCETKGQWKANHYVLSIELHETEKEIERLVNRKNNLVELIQQLEDKIHDSN